MSSVLRKADGIYRRPILSDQPEHQRCKQIDLSEVPQLSDKASLADVTPFSMRYDDGLQTWYVNRFDKTVIRAYREYRNEEDIEDGAFPVSVTYSDDKGQL